VNSKDGIDFAMLFTLKTTRKAGGLQILRSQGIAVRNYSFTLDAWTLKPSGFCNVGVPAQLTRFSQTPFITNRMLFSFCLDAVRTGSYDSPGPTTDNFDKTVKGQPLWQMHCPSWPF
jgi:hypothetical protein